MTSQPKRFPSIATLALAAAIGPLTMNLYLPSLPGITEYFQTSAATGQLSLSAYLLASAVMQLFIGPLSDKYGRRPIMLIFLFFMLGATLVCIFAPTIEIFLLGRVLQSSAAVGMVLSRAIVRDLVGRDEAASMIGYVTMGMTLAPMLAPVIGGVLEELYGWQASFWLLFAFTAFAICILWFDLNETNDSRGGSMRDQFEAWPELFKSHRFWGYSSCCALSSGAFFVFLGGAPLMAVEYYGLRPSYFGLYFFFIAMGYMIGNFIAGRFSVRVGINRMIMLGNIMILMGLCCALATTWAFPTSALAFFLPMFFIGFGNGITLPNANAGIVSVRPAIAGAASGLGASLQIGGGAALSAFTSLFVSPASGPTLLILVIMLSIIGAIVSSMYVIHIDRLRASQGTTEADA